MELLTLRQYAARYGIPYRHCQYLAYVGRIPDAQLVGRRYIVPSDATILVREIELPAYLYGGEPYEAPEYKKPGAKVGHRPYNTAHLIRLPGLYRTRTAHGYSQRGLARRSRCTPETIRRCERGHKVMPRTAIKLARGLGVDVSELMA